MPSKKRKALSREYKVQERRERRRRTAISRLQSKINLLPCKDKAFAESLINQWRRKRRLSDKQWSWVKKLADTVMPATAHPTRGPCSVYIISDGTSIKVGISKDPPARIRQLQTAQSRTLRLLGQYEVPTRVKAKNIEARVHRKFKNQLIRGEWFPLSLIPKIEQIVDDLASNIESGNKARFPTNFSIR